MRLICLATLLAASLHPSGVSAYEPEIHQQLTFIAARQFNNCVQNGEAVARLSALDTRYIAKSNVSQASGNVFTRMFRWNYYNRDDQTSRSTLGLIDTRFHAHFEELVDETRWARSRHRRLQNLGRILSYVQDMTAPARVVPVYTGRWWRFSLSDKFERYPIDGSVLEAAVMETCPDMGALNLSFQDLLNGAAARTIEALNDPIFGFPVTWQAYWRLADEADEFGEYGPAGNNFGDRTEFECGERKRCLLLNDDPLYRDFATARHLAAVEATIQAIALLQLDEAERGRAEVASETQP